MGAEMASKLLNDLRLQAAKPRDGACRLADGDDLYLLVLPSGVEFWRLRYRPDRRPG